MSPGAYIFQRPFLRGLLFGGAYIRRGLSTEGNLRFKIDWACSIIGSKLTVFACLTLYLRAIFQVQALGGLYLEGRFNGGFFALPDCGAYIWRGLYMEGLIFGILRYLICLTGLTPKLIGNITFYSLKLIRLLRVIFSSQQRLNRPAVNAVR